MTILLNKWSVEKSQYMQKSNNHLRGVSHDARDDGAGDPASARCAYQLLERPQIQLVLAHPPTTSMTRMNTGEVVEVFEGGWLELGEDLSHVRVIVVRHPAPAPGKDIPVGKRVGEWVYELFITTLGADGFLVEDVLDLYHGRGADRGRCWPMKTSKKIPIAGVPTPSVGKSCGKLRVNGCGTCASRL